MTSTQNASKHASRLFISYRRQDSEQAASRLAADLRQHFGRNHVFQDFASIDPGADVVQTVQRGLDTCAAVLVVIGPRWLTVVNRDGGRRIDADGDWVRYEVAESLRRPGVRVFPVLVDGAEMPLARDVPADLEPLTRRQAFPLTVRHWPEDVEKLVRCLREVPGLDRSVKRLAWLGIAFAVLAALGYWRFFHHQDRPDPPPAPPATAAPRLESDSLVKSEPKPPVKSRSEAETTQAASPARKAGDVFRDCSDCPEMVVIPAGRFLMGSPKGESGRSNDEGPQHKVTMAQPFAVGKYEVSFDEWDACVAAGGCSQRLSGDDHGWGRSRRPVIDVLWDYAQAYAAWLTKKTGEGYRLLSEAEWEYAARAGTTSAYPWGNKPGGKRANFYGSGSQWSGRRTAPVGSFAPNGFGLYDMIGNVGEWTQDCWNKSYAGAPDDGSAWLKGDCDRRVVRGGSWSDGPEGARAAYRNGYAPGDRLDNPGFRVARAL